MNHRRLMPLAFAGLLAACGREAAGPGADELVLAQEAQQIAQSAAATSGALHEGWLHRLLDTLRTTDDPEARAFLEQARAYRDSARTAREAGNYREARRYARLAFRSVLAAVLEIYPNAAVRTGAVVDNVIVRIEEFLGDRDAPRIRRVLAHVGELRAMSDRAADAGDTVTALALNLRALQILHRLVDHIRGIQDHDGVADAQMEAVGY
jgi:hypothetical protein